MMQWKKNVCKFAYLTSIPDTEQFLKILSWGSVGNIIRSICVVNLYSGSKNGIPWSIRHKYKYINYHFLNRNWNYKGSILYYHPIHTKVSIFQNIKDKTDDCLNCFNITWLVHLCTKNSSTFTLFTKKSELPLFE